MNPIHLPPPSPRQKDPHSMESLLLRRSYLQQAAGDTKPSPWLALL